MTSDTRFIEVKVVAPANRETSNMMTEFELTEVVSIRAQQIVEGCKPFVDIGDETNPIEIAKMEIKQKKCPMMIQRRVGNYIEEWGINEMIEPPDV